MEKSFEIQIFSATLRTPDDCSGLPLVETVILLVQNVGEIKITPRLQGRGFICIFI
jgi:hypothetical protein